MWKMSHMALASAPSVLWSVPCIPAAVDGCSRDGHSMQDVFVSPQGKVLVCASAGAEARAKPAPSGMDRTRRFILFLLYGIVMDGDWLAGGTFRVFHSDQPIPAPIRAKVTARLAAGGNLSPPSKKSETKIFEPMNTDTDSTRKRRINAKAGHCRSRISRGGC